MSQRRIVRGAQQSLGTRGTARVSKINSEEHNDDVEAARCKKDGSLTFRVRGTRISRQRTESERQGGQDSNGHGYDRDVNGVAKKSESKVDQRSTLLTAT